MPKPEVKDVEPESSTGDAEKGTATDGAQSDEKLPFNEHPRWKQVYGKVKEYEGIGTPEQIRAAVARLDYYEKIIAEAEAEAARADVEAKKPKVDEKTAELRAKARQELEEILPEVQEAKQAKHATDAFFASVEYRARKATAELMKETGIPASEGRMIEESLASIIGADADLYAEYLTNPKDAVKEAYGRLSKRFGRLTQTDADKQRTKEKQSTLPRVPKGTGSPGEGNAPVEGAKTIKEATKSVQAKLERLFGKE